MRAQGAESVAPVGGCVHCALMRTLRPYLERAAGGDGVTDGGFAYEACLAVIADMVLATGEPLVAEAVCARIERDFRVYLARFSSVGATQ